MRRIQQQQNCRHIHTSLLFRTHDRQWFESPVFHFHLFLILFFSKSVLLSSSFQYIFLHTYSHTYTYVHTNTHNNKHTHTHTHARTHSYASTNTDPSRLPYTRAHHTHTHSSPHTRTHIHTHKYTVLFVHSVVCCCCWVSS